MKETKEKPNMSDSLVEEDADQFQDDPVFIKKIKTEICDRKKLALNPVKQAKFKKAMVYTDIRLDFVKFLKEHLSSVRTQKEVVPLDEAKMKEILDLVGIIAGKGNFGEDKFYKKENKNLPEAVQENYGEFKKHFSELWGEVMKWKMTPSVYRNVVILLPEKVMLHLSKPLHMSDFLLESFKIGGPVGLVSLHGIFLLMQNFNFEVPDFYTRLYSMFTAETLTSKYRARFFAYSREFLSSTHLPEIMVASFTKKLSRLSTTAPASSLPLVFDFITNLLIQHPGLKVLLNPSKADGEPKIQNLTFPDYWDEDFESFQNKRGTVCLENPDPFDELEPDPMKSRAIESWLCEIKALQNHSISTIALKAKFIGRSMPKVEKDLDETLAFTYDDIEEMERRMCDKLEPTPSHIKPVAKWDEDEEHISGTNKKAKISLQDAE